MDNHACGLRLVPTHSLALICRREVTCSVLFSEKAVQTKTKVSHEYNPNGTRKRYSTAPRLWTANCRPLIW